MCVCVCVCAKRLKIRGFIYNVTINCLSALEN